jgi:hypothetical protein
MSKRNVHQQRIELDIKIDDLWKLMMKMPKWRYIWMKKIVSGKVQLNESTCETKVGGQQ